LTSRGMNGFGRLLPLLFENGVFVPKYLELLPPNSNPAH
jgi:hypothetical protein